MQTDLGTIYKLNIHIGGLPGTMDDVDFHCKFWTYRKELTVEKKDILATVLGFVPVWLAFAIGTLFNYLSE